MDKIYKTGDIPKEFLNSTFIAIPKTSNAMEFGEFRTISLIPHINKILLQLIRKRISPIIERNLSESQYGFRKNCGTSIAIHLLRTIGERMIQKIKHYLCAL